VALALLGGWAIVLTLSGTFAQLLNYSTVGEWLGHIFGIGTIFWYHKHCMDEPVTYHAPFYPVLPLIFMVTVFAVIVASAIHAPSDAGMSLVIIALGVPVYYAWRRIRPPV